MELVNDFLAKSAASSPGKVALITGDESLTYEKVAIESDGLAQGLIKGGFRPGDRAVIFMDNSAAMVTAIFGVLKAGGVFVPAHPSTKAERLRYIIDDTEATAFFLQGHVYRRVLSVLDRPSSLRLVIFDEPKDGDLQPKAALKALSSTVTTWSWTEALAHTERVRPPSRIDIDLAALIYTSGSTGHPKGVMLTHRNILCAAASISKYLELRHDDVILNVLPMSFDYGLYQLLMAFRRGATLVMEKSMTFPHAVLPLIAQYGVTGLPVVPTMSAILLGLNLSSYDFGSLRFMTNTGAAWPGDHIAKWRRILPHVQIFSMYGLTECKRVSYLPPQDLERKVGSVGLAIPNTEVMVLDAHGEEVPANGVGELVVRGGHVMQGYWRAPELTSQKLRPGCLPGERWLHTGDLFRKDQDGYLYFEGRTDDIIKSRGEKVSPLEIEEILHRQSGVAEAAVVGKPDPVLGEAITAFLTPLPGHNLDTKSILRAVKDSLEDYKVPTHLFVRSALPRTHHGKIDKAALKKEGENAECQSLAGRS